MFRKIFLTIIFTILGLFSFTSAYQVDLPSQTADIKSEGSISASKEDDFVVHISKVVNKYLWFILGAIAFGMVIYAGVLLLKSSGDEAEFKKGNKILIWGLIGIFVALGAYTIINLLINVL